MALRKFILSLFLVGLTSTVAVAAPKADALPDGDDAYFQSAPPPSPEWSASGIPEIAETDSLRPRYGLRVSSRYGRRADPLGHAAELHQGIDLPARPGTPVVAAEAGIVRVAGPAGGYGKLVAIDHGGGVETRYAHLSRVLVRAGEHVDRGAAIGLVGSTGRSTGAHLHYEINVRGRAFDPSRPPIAAIEAAAVPLPPRPVRSGDTISQWRSDAGSLPIPVKPSAQMKAAVAASRAASSPR